MNDGIFQEQKEEEMETGSVNETSAGQTKQPQAGEGPERKPFYVQTAAPHQAGVPPYRPSQPAYAAAPVQKPQKVRRVGTFTMGVALIAAGVTALVFLFRPSWDIIPILKLAPVLLILLGVEILASHLLFREDKLKYDFLSGFFCFLLILGSAGAAVIAPLYEQFGPARSTAEYTLEQQVDDLCYEQLKGTPAIGSLEAQVSLHGLVTGETYQSRTLRPEDSVRVRVGILGDYQDAEGFSQACRTVLDGLNRTGVDFDSIRFEWQEGGAGDRSFELSVSDRFQADMDASQLSQLVEVYGIETSEDVQSGDSL